MSDFEPARHTKMHEGMGRFGHDEPAGDTYYQESAGTSTYYCILKSSVDIPSYIEQKCISSQCEEATEVRVDEKATYSYRILMKEISQRYPVVSPKKRDTITRD